MQREIALWGNNFIKDEMTFKINSQGNNTKHVSEVGLWLLSEGALKESITIFGLIMIQH